MSNRKELQDAQEYCPDDAPTPLRGTPWGDFDGLAFQGEDIAQLMRACDRVVLRELARIAEDSK